MALRSNRADPARIALPTGVEVASYSSYVDAQKAVDFLSDNNLPVAKVSIVGTDLRMVERVLGRLTYGRVAASGAMSGAWFGLLIGLVLMIMQPAQPGMMMAAVLMGAAFGILAGVVGFAVRRRDRDFTSTSQVVASRYAIVAEPDVSQQVRRELEAAGLGGRASGNQPTYPEPGGGYPRQSYPPQQRGGGQPPQGPHRDGQNYQPPVNYARPQQSQNAGPGGRSARPQHGSSAMGAPHGSQPDRHAGRPPQQSGPHQSGPQQSGPQQWDDRQPGGHGDGSGGERAPDAPPQAPGNVTRSEWHEDDGKPRYGIRLAPGQRIEDVMGRRPAPNSAQPGTGERREDQ